MRNKTEINYLIKIDGSSNKLENITQQTNICERTLSSTLEDIYNDLDSIFNIFTSEERIALRRCLRRFQDLFRDYPECRKWLEGMIRQMNLNQEDYSFEKLSPLIHFLVLLSAANFQYKLEQENHWYKIVCKNQNNLRKKFCLFDFYRTSELPLKVVGIKAIRFLLEGDYKFSSEELVLICRAYFHCKKQCGDQKGLLPSIISNITDPTDKDYIPMIMDMDQTNGVRITCGTCLVNIWKYPTNREILEEVLSDVRS